MSSFLFKNKKFACDIIQQDDQNVDTGFDPKIRPMKAIDQQIHKHPVQNTCPQTAEKERNGFPDNLFPSGSFTVENPFPVGQISEENGKKPRDNRAWDDRQAQRVGTEPINADIDSSGQCTECILMVNRIIAGFAYYIFYIDRNVSNVILKIFCMVR